MTIPSTPRKAGPLLGNGVQTSWPFTFKVFADTDILVTVADNLGIESELTLTSDYTVTLNSNQETSPGGAVTYLLPDGYTLVITGDIDYDQPLDLPSGGAFSPTALENELDRLTMQIQQLREAVNRAVQAPITSNASGYLPSPQSNALIGWNESETAMQNFPLSDIATGIAFATYRYDTYTGDGTTTSFVLSADPVTLGNIDVSVDGQTYVPGVDHTLVGQNLVFTVAPADGVEILARYGQGMASGVSGDALDISYQPAGVGAELTTVEAKLKESVSVKDFGAVGDGITDDTAAIQAAINYCVSKGLYFPSGTYKTTSQLSISSPTFAPGETIKLYGDGPYNSVIAADGNFTALFVQDSAGTKGGAYDLGIINTGNPYMGGGAVTFNHAASVGIKLRDVFQFELDNVIVEQFGAGLLVNNYSYWSEGTFAKNFWARNNKIGVHFLRENAGTDSFSHTQMIGLKIQVPKDNATGKWQTAFKVEGLPAGAGAVQIYNGYIQGNFWTGDGTGSAPNLGEYIYLTNKGRITESFVAISFERFGKILIDDTSYFANCHTFFSSLDASQVSLVDNNASKNAKFRSQYRGNINLNAVNMAVSNWQGTGVTASMRQGMQDSSATGFHFGTGAGLSFPFATSLNGTGNGFFYGTSPDYEDNVTWRFKVDHNGDVFPRLSYSGLTSGNGAPGTLGTGYAYMQADSDQTVDLAPLWVGIGGTITAPVQVARIVTTAGRPSGPTGGQMFFDSTLGKPVWWNGSNWKDATGATV